jgi:hypothetical protein
MSTFSNVPGASLSKRRRKGGRRNGRTEGRKEEGRKNGEKELNGMEKKEWKGRIGRRKERKKGRK